MILKDYQKQVINDLRNYISKLSDNSAAGAYKIFWKDKGIAIGHFKEINPYHDLIGDTAAVCVKVPTGGGKTFIACNALRVIFDEMFVQTKVVVWLVPSDAILTQTLNALKNPAHPYRQAINADFNGRVAVYTKDQLLNGQNFSRVSIEDQLSIMVLSYDSFRGRGKEFLKSKQDNPNLSSFSDDGKDISLLETINKLNPVIIVDESHHAKSTLSIEMLKNFNPRFVLELTATPRNGSNIISFVNAKALKTENMVKLPVIAYNQQDSREVIVRAIELRNNLEALAKVEQQNGGKYIRPIVLFQAQANTGEDSITFEKIRTRLIESYSIPAEQIAIRTAQIDELKNINLLSESCPIRYIITINALGEGWDCPFAYILASLANKSSTVDVEQILGRILRLPNTRHNDNKLLNMSYVLTSSAHFQTTLDNIIKALNGEGFSDKECKIVAKPKTIAQPFEFTPPSFTPSTTATIDDFSDEPITMDEFTETALAQCEEYENHSSEEDNLYLPEPVVKSMPRYEVRPEFADDVENIRVPKFVYEIKTDSGTLFDNSRILDDSYLAIDFDLKNESAKMSFEGLDEEIYKIDADEGGAMKSKAAREFQIYLKEHCTTAEERINLSRTIIFKRLDKKFEDIPSKDLKIHINRAIESMSADLLERLQNFPQSCADIIEANIKTLLLKHSEKTFYRMLSAGKIKCEAKYKMKQAINPMNADTTIARSLYTGEDKMNETEQKFILNLTALDNIKWWHRNIARQEFFINGFINHYPDFMIMTNGDKIIFAETKGKHLDNEDTAQKAKLGRAWSMSAGSNYDYYMIFDDINMSNLSDGITNVNEFMGIVRGL